MTKEEFYDQEIAPILMELAKKCEAQEIPFIAVVEYGVGSFGRTTFIGNPPDAAMRIINYAVKCEGNVDALMGVIIKDAKYYGHSSMFLHLQGVPEKPAEVPPT